MSKIIFCPSYLDNVLTYQNKLEDIPYFIAYFDIYRYTAHRVKVCANRCNT